MAGLVVTNMLKKTIDFQESFGVSLPVSEEGL